MHPGHLQVLRWTLKKRDDADLFRLAIPGGALQR